MTKKDAITLVVEALKQNDVRKPVSFPKQTFHITDDEGNHKDFFVRKSDKTVMYNKNDVSAVIEAFLQVVEDAMKRGEEIYLHGFGTFGLRLRAARKTKLPGTDGLVDVKERYVPKFSFGNKLRMAAITYDLSVRDRDISLPPITKDEDFDCEYDEQDSTDDDFDDNFVDDDSGVNEDD